MTEFSPKDIKNIYKLGDGMKKFIVDTTLDICRIPTVNYLPEDYPGEGPDGMDMPGHEEPVVAILEKILDGWKIPHYRKGRVPERPSLFASVGQKKKGERQLMFLLHTDVVPAGDPETWKFPAFETFEKKGKLYGRGVLDNKGPLVATLATLKILKDHEKDIPGEVIFAAVADEEVQAGYGLDWLLENKLIKCDEAIVPDIAGEMKVINIAEKGRVGLRIKAMGKAAHAMQPEQGVNAINGLAAVIAKVEKMKMPHKKHPLLNRPTLNIGVIRGGTAANAVPDKAEVTVDIRYVPGQKESDIKKQVQAICNDVKAKRPGLKFKIEVPKGAPPIEVKPNAPIVKAILRHAPKAEVEGTGGGTFAHALVERGIDAVGWSPGHGKTYHQPNEEIPVKQLTTYTGMLAAVVLERMNEK